MTQPFTRIEPHNGQPGIVNTSLPQWAHSEEWEFYTNPLARVYTPNPSDFDRVTGEEYQVLTADALQYLQRSEVPETVENGPDWQTILVHDYEPADVSELVSDMMNLAEVAWRMLVDEHAHIERMTATARRPAECSVLFGAYLAKNSDLI